MADFKIFVDKYNAFQSTFKACSLDDSHAVYLCQDDSQAVINFDKIVENLYPDPYKRPKSFDALWENENRIYCIEFKNRKPAYIDNSDVQKKLTDGIDLLQKLFAELHIQKKDFEFYYCVIYQNCTEPIERYKCGIGKGAVSFGLDQYKNVLVKDIFTNRVDFFTKAFQKNFQKDLHC